MDGEDRGHGRSGRWGGDGIREGLFEEGGPAVNGPVFGGEPFEDELGILGFLHLIEHGEGTRGEDGDNDIWNVRARNDMLEVCEGIRRAPM